MTIKHTTRKTGENRHEGTQFFKCSCGMDWEVPATHQKPAQCPEDKQ